MFAVFEYIIGFVIGVDIAVCKWPDWLGVTSLEQCMNTGCWLWDSSQFCFDGLAVVVSLVTFYYCVNFEIFLIITQIRF